MSECPATWRRVAAGLGGITAGGPGFKWTNHREAGPRRLAARTPVRGLVVSAQTVVRLVRERSACPPGLLNVNYGCFDGQRKLDHTTERLQGGFKVPMETGRHLEHTTERHQRGFMVPMETGSLYSETESKSGEG